MNKVKFFDMCFFSLIGFISCYVSLIFFYSENQTNYYVNFTMLVTMLSVIRWGRSGVIVYFFSTLPLMILIQDIGLLIAHNLVTTAFLILPSLVFEKIDNHKFVEKSSWGIMFIVSMFFFSSLGETIYTIVLNDLSFLPVFQLTFTVNLFMMVMTIVVYLIIKTTSPSLFFDLKTI